jgi:hypothetical protein
MSSFGWRAETVPCRVLQSLSQDHGKCLSHVTLHPRDREKFERESTRLKVRASNEDLGRYIDGHILKLPSFISHNAYLAKEIKTAIIRAVDGM